jgi:hypothetical protein
MARLYHRSGEFTSPRGGVKPPLRGVAGSSARRMVRRLTDKAAATPFSAA